MEFEWARAINVYTLTELMEEKTFTKRIWLCVVTNLSKTPNPVDVGTVRYSVCYFRIDNGIEGRSRNG